MRVWPRSSSHRRPRTNRVTYRRLPQSATARNPCCTSGRGSRQSAATTNIKGQMTSTVRPGHPLHVVVACVLSDAGDVGIRHRYRAEQSRHARAVVGAEMTQGLSVRHSRASTAISTTHRAAMQILAATILRESGAATCVGSG